MRGAHQRHAGWRIIAHARLHESSYQGLCCDGPKQFSLWLVTKKACQGHSHALVRILGREHSTAYASNPRKVDVYGGEGEHALFVAEARFLLEVGLEEADLWELTLDFLEPRPHGLACAAPRCVKKDDR